jgi:THO complex subunit 4
VGPIRTKASGRGKPAAAEPAKRERREKKKPQTAEELDQELEAFMDDSGPGAAADAQAAPASVDAAEDAVMA